mgnify:CR=1 FL=1
MSFSRIIGIRIFATVVFCFSGISHIYGQEKPDTEKKLFLGPVELKFEPTYTIENFIKPPRIKSISQTGTPSVEQTGTEQVFEMIFSFGIETAIPRVGLTFETMWKPFTKTDENLFTGGTSTDLGTEINDNYPEIESELNFSLFTFEQTRGWSDAHFDIVDKFSPAKRPYDKRNYTHKLNFELDIAFGIFQWIKKDCWLRDVELETSFDYIATGLPKKGDIFPEQGIEYLDNACPWAVSFLVVIPIAPLKLRK